MGILLRVALLLVMVVVAVRAAARFMAGLSQGMRQQGDAPRPGTPPVKMVKDPVCGTFVVPGKALSAASGGTTVWFCSEACRDQYARRD